MIVDQVGLGPQGSGDEFQTDGVLTRPESPRGAFVDDDNGVVQLALAENAAGSGFSRTALTRLKIAVLAPMPRASVIMATGGDREGFAFTDG
jgi:hypothetical protein